MFAAFLISITSPIFIVGDFPMSIADILGFISGLACVAAAARGHILNFPFGLLNCSILAIIFLKSRLFGDMALQGVFFILTSIGWLQWLRDPQGVQARPKSMKRYDFWVGAVVTLIATLGLRQGLIYLGGAAPWMDAFITSASLWAQWLLNRKSVSTWPWWIAIDLVSIPLYLSRQIPLIAALYAIFLVLCIQGWLRWRQTLVT